MKIFFKTLTLIGKISVTLKKKKNYFVYDYVICITDLYTYRVPILYYYII